MFQELAAKNMFPSCRYRERKMDWRERERERESEEQHAAMNCSNGGEVRRGLESQL